MLEELHMAGQFIGFSAKTFWSASGSCGFMKA